MNVELKEQVEDIVNILKGINEEKISEDEAVEEWGKIREEFDQIGYCCFTPRS